MRTLMRAVQPTLTPSTDWRVVRDGDPTANALYCRHYSCRRYADGRDPRLIVGPGAKIVLVTEDGLALFAWRKFRPMDGMIGVNCAVFRNEGAARSSDLILTAEMFARERWPGEPFYTYVRSDRIASSNPGFCFLRAGWTRREIRHGGRLHVLTKEVRDVVSAG